MISIIKRFHCFICGNYIQELRGQVRHGIVSIAKKDFVESLEFHTDCMLVKTGIDQSGINFSEEAWKELVGDNLDIDDFRLVEDPKGKRYYYKCFTISENEFLNRKPKKI